MVQALHLKVRGCQKGYKSKIKSILKLILNIRHINRLQVKKWKNIYHVNTNQKKAGMLVLISYIDFTAKNIERDKKGQLVMMKWSVIEGT